MPRQFTVLLFAFLWVAQCLYAQRNGVSMQDTVSLSEDYEYAYAYYFASTSIASSKIIIKYENKREETKVKTYSADDDRNHQDIADIINRMAKEGFILVTSFNINQYSPAFVFRRKRIKKRQCP